MRLSLRRIAALAILAGAMSLSAQAAQTQLSATLRVTVDGVTSAGGTLRVGLYDEATFPAIADFALFKREIPRIAGDVAVVFERLPPGTYAVRVFQDLNDNGRADAGEPMGVSNAAARENFTGAALVLHPGANMAAIHLR